MSSEWTSCLLENVLEVKYGKDHKKLGQGAIPVYGSGGVMRYADAALYDDESILIPRKGSLNNVLFENKPFWTVDTMFWSKIDKTRAFPKFLYYQLSVIDFMSLSIGSAVPSMTVPVLNALEITLPPLNEQKSIADALSALDDRISLLSETNTTLESIAQALFKSWFVDFDPVRAKQQGITPQGMDTATAALFPDSFEESELGEVPKGWRAGTLGDYIKLKKGTVNPGTQPQELFQHFSLPAFDNEQCAVLELGEAIKSNKTPVPVNAVLLSKLNPHIPRIWLPMFCKPNAVCSTEFLVFQPTETGSKELIYCIFKSPVFIARLQQIVTGTSNSHQRIKPDQVALMNSVIATKAVTKAFEAITRPLLEKVNANKEQAQTLATLRDTLLPRLISGQLRLPV